MSAGEQRSGADGPSAQCTRGRGGACRHAASKWPSRSSCRKGPRAASSGWCVTTTTAVNGDQSYGLSIRPNGKLLLVASRGLDSSTPTKTDREIAAAGEERYRRQVALYATAIAQATGQPADAVLLRV